MAIDWEARKLAAWDALVAAAQEGRCLTYSELAAKIDNTTGPRQVGRVLYPIQDCCKSKGLPPLTGIVIQKATGKPGPGFLDAGRDFKAVHQEVFAYPWNNRPYPCG